MSAPSWSFRTYFLPVIALAVAAACSDRQAPAGPDDAGLQPGFKGKPGGGDIVVSSVDPPEAEQGVTLEVDVLGRNFPKGEVESCSDPVVEDCTWAEFRIDEVVDGKVKTNSSTWVSSRKLTAEITIDAEAIPALYDAIVTFRGRRGIGAEKFRVKVKPNETLLWPLEITLADRTDDVLLSEDGRSYAYGHDPTENLSAYILNYGNHFPGGLEIERRWMETPEGEIVMSERRFHTELPQLTGICEAPPYDEIVVIWVDGGHDPLGNDHGHPGLMKDQNGNVLPNGFLDLPVPTDGDDPDDPQFSATAVMGFTWLNFGTYDWGRTDVRYGLDCSSANNRLSGEVGDRVTVTALRSDPETGHRRWAVEALSDGMARVCQFGRKKVKGKEPDANCGEFPMPFRFEVDALSASPVPE